MRHFLLAAAALAAVQPLHAQDKPAVQPTLTFERVFASPALAGQAPRGVKLSPDGKWLAAVSCDSDVQMLRICPDPSKPKLSQVIDKVVELEQQSRELPQTAFKSLDQTINKVTFSWDNDVDMRCWW